jgi:hypothetical protein
MNHTSIETANIEARSFTSSNLEYERVIESILESGVTLGEIAMILKSSPILFSHLCLALGVLINGRVCSIKPVFAARILQNRLSRNSSSGGNPMRSEALAVDKEREALDGCQLILTWLAGKELTKADHQRVLREARLRVALTEAFKSRAGFNLDKPTNDAIDLCWTAASTHKGVGIIAWFAQWLAQLAFHWIEDSQARARAIDLALSTEDCPARPGPSELQRF